MKKNFYLSFLIMLLFAFDLQAQWFPQESGTTDLLYSIQFTDINNGWVTNLNGTKLFHTTNGGADWFVQKDFGTSTIWNFTFINDSIGYFYSRDPGNLLKSTDGGSNWQLIHTFGASIDYIKWYDENTGWGVVFSLTGSLIKTTNGGVDWQGFDYFNSFEGGFGRVGIINENSVIVPGQYFTGDNIIFKTTDGGTTWTEIPTSVELLGGRIQFINTNTGWIVSSGNLYKTTDGGINWEFQTAPVYDFFFVNELMGWYISGNQIKQTTDGGQTWLSQNSGTDNTLYTIYFLDQNNGWISGDSGTILYTTNGGTPVELISFTACVSGNDVNLNWSTASETNNEGFKVEKSQNSKIKSQKVWTNIGFVSGNGTTTEQHNYLFIDKDLSGGQYFYRLKQIDYDGSFKYSKVVEVIVNVQTEFSLSQNYPNPFNPVTNISYAITQSGFVALKIYDVLGNQVADLVNEEKPAGSYTVQFDGSNLSSGIYFYKLNAGNYIQVRKMLLLK